MNIIGVTLIVLVTIGFSVAVLFSKVSLKEMRPERFTMYYIFGAVVVMTIEVIAIRPKIGIGYLWNQDLIIILISSIFGAVAYFFGYIGLKGTFAGISSTIFNLQGLLITFIGAIAYRIFPGYNILFGLLVSLFGLYLIGIKGLNKTKIKVDKSFIFLTLSPVLWALEWVCFSFVSSTSPIFYTYLLYSFIFLLLFIVNVAFVKKSSAEHRNMKMLAIYGGFFSGLGNAAYGIFISEYGTALTGVITILSVPVSVILAIIILRERYTKIELVGIVAVFIGLMIALVHY
ncbi:MAG: DMT family transporter [Thermoplasmata archaeon]